MTKPVAIGAFIFAGGFTEGVLPYFDVRAHLEDGSFGVKTFKLNHPEIPVYDTPGTWPLDALRSGAGKVDLIYGNPPCALWSPASNGNKGMATIESYLARYIMWHVQLLEDFRPHAWVMESVPQLVSKGAGLVHNIQQMCARLGYQLTIVLHDGKFLGLPQSRRRVFLVAHNIPIPWSYKHEELVTVGEALTLMGDAGYDPGEIKPMPERLRPWIEDLPQGKYLHQYLKSIGRYDDYHGGGKLAIKRLAWDGPAFTILRPLSETIHPLYNRFLGMNEAKVLCGYPVDYKFQSSSAADVELGKTVTPPAARWLAHCLAQAFEDAESTYGTVTPGQVVELNMMAKSPRLTDLTPVNTYELVTDRYA